MIGRAVNGACAITPSYSPPLRFPSRALPTTEDFGLDQPLMLPSRAYLSLPTEFRLEPEDEHGIDRRWERAEGECDCSIGQRGG